jgi:hypothetical protein
MAGSGGFCQFGWRLLAGNGGLAVLFFAMHLSDWRDLAGNGGSWKNFTLSESSKSSAGHQGQADRGPFLLPRPGFAGKG